MSAGILNLGLFFVVAITRGCVRHNEFSTDEKKVETMRLTGDM